MSVDSKHEEYIALEEDYELIEHILKGQREIKNQQTKYLPMLEGQDPDEYISYLDRGVFYNAFARTAKGMVGNLLRKPPEIIFPENLKEKLESITPEGKSFDDLTRLTCLEVMSYGRFGLLVDKDGEDGDPYIATYKANTILNWRTERINGKEQLTLLVLHEYVEVDSADEFDPQEVEQLRVFRLLPDVDDTRGDYQMYVETEVWQENTNPKDTDGGFYLVEDPIIPTIQGKRLEKIPFVVVGAIDNSIEPNIPPLLDLANLNIYHWQKSVDLSHGLHFTALPTPWAAGFPDKQKMFIGPTHAWVSRDPQARCGYLEFSGEGLSALEKNLEKTEFQMAALGARMIDHPRKGVESAETARLRQASELATLSSISDTISAGLTEALRLYSEWEGSEQDDIDVRLNKDFIEAPISSQKILALLQALQAGTITLETYLYNMKSGEVLPPDITPEEEIKRLKEQMNTLEPHEFRLQQEVNAIDQKSSQQVEEVGTVDNKNPEQNDLNQGVQENKTALKGNKPFT